MHGLADLLVSYLLEEFNTLPSILDNTQVSDEALLSYYYNTHASYLKNNFYTVRVGDKSVFSDLSTKPNTKIGQYMSAHIISIDKGGRELTYDAIGKEVNEISKSISPFATKINNPFKKSYSKFESELQGICSVVAVTTPNKFSIFQTDPNGYISFMPEFTELEEYIAYNYYMRMFLNESGETLMYSKGDKICRPKIQYCGSFCTDEFKTLENILGIKDKYINFLDMIISFNRSKNRIIEKYDLPVKHWYSVESGNITIMHYNKEFDNLVLSENDLYSSLRDLIYEKEVYNENNAKRVLNFLVKFDKNSIHPILRQNILLKRNNKIIENFIKVNYMNNSIETIKTIAQNIGRSLYFKARDYKEGENAIEEKKAQMVREVFHILDRTNTIIEFFSEIASYYSKHKIYNPLPIEIDELLNSGQDKKEFDDLLKIYLLTKNKSREVVVEKENVEFAYND